MWKLREALRLAIFRLKHPVLFTHSSGWLEEDHMHICIAARLLQEDDFVSVCPHRGECNIDIDDRCDNCNYLRVLDFITNEDNTKSIILH